MKFSTEEITLCKEIAKYYRKPIGFGDWFYDEEIEHIGIHVYTMILEEDVSGKIPLWTWQDARDWLRKEGYELTRFFSYVNKVGISFYKKGVQLSSLCGEGKTDLEAILKVILEILKEIK